MIQKTKAHERLIFEEFFLLETTLAARRAGFEREIGILIPKSKKLVPQFLKALPFELTNAQKRCFEEVELDYQKSFPMNRLLQGDVGAGKTMIAWLASLPVIELGMQVVLMAPTEILADQHYKNAVKLLAPLGIKVALLTGRIKEKEKHEISENLKSGEVQFVIGTHALIEDSIEFQNLGLVIVDEQHRFGVEQRAKLKMKGKNPHHLIMTATPIPRTLALTAFGDLDVSIVDELPPGRSPIQTRVIFDGKRIQALDFLKQQIDKGRQAYVVYPLVEESEKIDLKNALEECEKLKSYFPQFSIGVIHGRMKSNEKDQIMDEFRSGKIQILVSTTVIEVGVDVPNANIMVIEHAERFGLSQLHQLRGRVGRGEHKSFCVLICGYAVSEEGKARLDIMESTNDGFKIAEADLEIRGPGEFLGTRQAGLQGFKMAHLIRDVALLKKARDFAFETLRRDARLNDPENSALREELISKEGPSFLASIA